MNAADITARDAVDINVRYSGGAYNTNTSRGHRSSSTSGPEAAALRQAEKLFGKQLQSVVRISDVPGVIGSSVWRATAQTQPKDSSS